MIFVNNISQLPYYNPNPLGICYCEKVIQPTDVYLQGTLPKGSYSTGTVQVLAYDANGTTLISDITSHFSYAIYNYNGIRFRLVMVSLPPELCGNKCFVLNVIIKNSSGKTVFDKWTMDYCLNECCVVPSGVTVTGDNTPTVTGDVTNPTPQTFGNFCLPVLNIVFSFPCYDAINNVHYGDITSPIKSVGDYNTLTNISLNLFACMRYNPLEITKVFSRNCKQQRVESQPSYELQTIESLPLWKVQELEGLLHATKIFVGGVEYIFSGGTPFERLIDKWDFYRGKITLQKCNRWQIFGCSECDNEGGTKYGGLLRNSGAYYSDNGTYIGSTADEVISYLNSVEQANAAIYTPTASGVSNYSIIKVSSSFTGYIYNGSISAKNRVYFKEYSTPPTTNQVFGLPENAVTCDSISVSGIASYEMTCGAVTIGTISSEYVFVIASVNTHTVNNGSDYSIFIDEIIPMDAFFGVCIGKYVCHVNGVRKFPDINILSYEIGNLSTGVHNISITPYDCQGQEGQTFTLNITI